MKLKGTVDLTIIVSGKDGRECGSHANHCRLMIEWDKCGLFKTKLKDSSKTYGFLRCKECLRAFK